MTLSRSYFTWFLILKNNQHQFLVTNLILFILNSLWYPVKMLSLCSFKNMRGLKNVLKKKRNSNLQFTVFTRWQCVRFFLFFSFQNSSLQFQIVTIKRCLLVSEYRQSSRSSSRVASPTWSAGFYSSMIPPHFELSYLKKETITF